MGLLLLHPTMSELHCSAEEIAAFIDNGLSRTARNTVAAHLADCGVCRAEWIAVRRMAPESQASPAGFPFSRRTWLVAAAAALVLLVVPLSRRDPSPDSAAQGAMRSGGIDGGSLRAISPRELVPGAARFVWSDAGDATYRVVITDSSGTSIWTATTRDTSVTLPSGRTLVRGKQYYWSVDALKPDGSSYTSGAVSFSVRE